MPRLSPRLRQPVHPDTNPWSPLLRYFHNPFSAWQAVQLPLSGDVTQAINPWSWTFGSASSQVGLVNINLGRSTDPELEQEVLDEVGSYGKQPGGIGDALVVLIRHVKLEDLDAGEIDAITALRFQLEEIARVKTRLSFRFQTGSVRETAAEHRQPGEGIRRWWNMSGEVVCCGSGDASLEALEVGRVWQSAWLQDADTSDLPETKMNGT